MGRLFLAAGHCENHLDGILQHWTGETIFAHIQNTRLQRRLELAKDLTAQRTASWGAQQVGFFIAGLERFGTLAQTRNLLAHNSLGIQSGGAQPTKAVIHRVVQKRSGEPKITTLEFAQLEEAMSGFEELATFFSANIVQIIWQSRAQRRQPGAPLPPLMWQSLR